MLPEVGLLTWAHWQACELHIGGTGNMARPHDTSQAARRRNSSPHQCAAAVHNACPAYITWSADFLFHRLVYSALQQYTGQNAG